MLPSYQVTTNTVTLFEFAEVMYNIKIRFDFIGSKPAVGSSKIKKLGS